MGGGLGGEGEERNSINMELATRPSDTVGVGEDNTNEVDIILTGGGSSVSSSSKVSDAARTDEAGMSAVLTISLSPGDSTTGELPGTDMARLRRTFSFRKARASLCNVSKDTESQVVQELFFLDI